MKDEPASAVNTPYPIQPNDHSDAEILRHGGIIEIAVRNQSVSDYMNHWESRALAAEAQLAVLQSGDKPSERPREEPIEPEWFPNEGDRQYWREKHGRTTAIQPTRGYIEVFFLALRDCSDDLFEKATRAIRATRSDERIKCVRQINDRLDECRVWWYAELDDDVILLKRWPTEHGK